MIASDFVAIEEALGISLPVAYKQALSPYPIVPLAGNSDQLLWDNANEIIKLNENVRAGRFDCEPWPNWLFAIGESNTETIAIDIRDPSAPAWWIDHFDYKSKGSGQTHARFEDWLEKYVSGADVEDPKSSPEEYKRFLSEKAAAWRIGYLVILIVFIISIVVLLLQRASLPR